MDLKDKRFSPLCLDVPAPNSKLSAKHNCPDMILNRVINVSGYEECFHTFSPAVHLVLRMETCGLNPRIERKKGSGLLPGYAKRNITSVEIIAKKEIS